MDSINLTAHVDREHQLTAIVPPSIPPGPVNIIIVPSQTVDGDEAEWTSVVMHGLEAELADARQDIYTLADGEPVDGA